MKKIYKRPAAAIYTIKPCTAMAVSQQVYDEVTEEEGLAREYNGGSPYQDSGSSEGQNATHSIWDNMW